MAARLTKKLSGEVSQVSRAVQHWTTAGLLSTVEGEPHQGTGRHRLYNEEALYRAAILLTLSQYGLQIKHLRSAMDQLSEGLDPKRWIDFDTSGFGPISDAFPRAASGEPIVFVYGFHSTFEGKLKDKKNTTVVLSQTHPLGLGVLFNQNNKPLRDWIEGKFFTGSFITVKLRDLVQGL